MEEIKFYYANKEYYYQDILIFTGTLEWDMKNDENKRDEMFIKTMRHRNWSNFYIRQEFRQEFMNLTDKELLDGMVIKNLPKPSTFPKFNNEQPFQIKFDKKIIKNPKIIAIRWSGYVWEYQIENIGHKHDFQPESKLEKYE